MSIELIGLITLLAGLASLWLSPSFGFGVMIVSMLLESAAALIIPGLGSIQPAHLLLGFVLLSIARDRALVRKCLSYIRFPGAGFWLLCTLGYCLASAYFLPRLFAGRVDVNAVSSALYVDGLFLIPLAPSTGNITQTVYFIGDVCCFFACCGFASSEGGFLALARALVLYCFADIGFAFVDMLTSQIGASAMLDFMRNSTYVIYTDTSVGNMKRIIGSFTEASAFAYATIAVFCWAMRLWLGGTTKSAFPIAAVSLLLILLSTSSTGYVALPVCLGFLYAGALLRMLHGNATKTDTGFVLLSPLMGLIVLLAILLNHEWREAIQDFLGTFILNKSLSQSGIERGRVNVEALQTFFDTMGLGAGLGSVRASSFLLACLSNLGAIGSLLLAGFIGSVLLGSHRDDSDATHVVRSAARCGCLGLLVAGTISGALIDLGLPFFAMAALACARPGEARRRRPSMAPAAASPAPWGGYGTPTVPT